MPSLTNSPAKTVSFALERRKSYQFRVTLLNGDGSAVNLTGATLRFVLKAEEWDDDQFDLTNLVVNSTATLLDAERGYAQFNLQAAELDQDPGDYWYAIVVWLPDAYSGVVLKGDLALLANPESDSMHHQYDGDIVAGPELEITLRAPGEITVVTNNLDRGAKGDKGDTGDKGDKGDTGDKGDKGDTGPGGTITIRNVFTGAAGSAAAVVNVGTPQASLLDITIPRGDKGDTGDKGDKGDRGDVGPAGLEWRGVWDPGTDYVIDDAVQYASASWVASADPPLGEVPSDASAYWQALALQGTKGDKGDKGDTGDTGPVGPEGPSGAPIGCIQMWAGAVASVPAGWLLCNGASFSPTTYPGLAAVLGTMYGGTAGAPLLPNLKGRVPVGQDAGQTEFDTIGEAGGAKTHTLGATEIPAHTHTMAHTHSIAHDHGSFTSGSEAAHTHSIAHDHASFTSGTEAAHTHAIDHDHGAFTSGAEAAHTHGPGTLTGYYRGRGSDDSGTGASGLIEYTYSAYNTTSSNGAVVLNAGASGAGSAHSHSIDVPAHAGNSGAGSAHSHAVDVPAYSGNSGAGSAHSHSVDVPTYSGNSGASSAGDTGSAGGGGAHNNLQPYLVLNYIIRAA